MRAVLNRRSIKWWSSSMNGFGGQLKSTESYGSKCGVGGEDVEQVAAHIYK